jgi:hypothetical protein
VLAVEHDGVLTLTPGYRWWWSAVRKQVLGLVGFAAMWDAFLGVFTVVLVSARAEVPWFVWLFMAPFYAVGTGLPLGGAFMAWREDHVGIGRGLYVRRSVVQGLTVRRRQLPLGAITGVCVSGSGNSRGVTVTAGTKADRIERLAPPEEAKALAAYLSQCLHEGRPVGGGRPD